MQMLLKLKGQTNYFKNQKAGLINMWERTRSLGKSDAQRLKDNFPIFQENLNLEIAQFGRDLDFIFKEYPELGDALAEMIKYGRLYACALNGYG